MVRTAQETVADDVSSFSCSRGSGWCCGGMWIAMDDGWTKKLRASKFWPGGVNCCELSASSKAESASHASSITTRVFPSLSDHLPHHPSFSRLPLTFASSHTTTTYSNMQCTRRLLAPPGFWKRSLQEFSRLSGIGTYSCSQFLLYHHCCFS